MRKTDQVLMWEAFEGSISQGGPLGGSSKSSSSGQSSGNDSEESDEPGLMGLLAQLLQGVEDGSIDEGEACEHLSMILSGEVEAMEDESPEEQDMEDEEYDDEEDAENVRRPSAGKFKRPAGVRGLGNKDLNEPKNSPRPKPEGVRGLGNEELNKPRKTPRLDAMGRPLKDTQRRM